MINIKIFLKNLNILEKNETLNVRFSRYMQENKLLQNKEEQPILEGAVENVKNVKKCPEMSKTGLKDCPIPICTSIKGRMKRPLRHLPSKLKYLPNIVWETIFKEFRKFFFLNVDVEKLLLYH